MRAPQRTGPRPSFPPAPPPTIATTPLPTDPNAVPQEDELANAGGWRFLSMTGVPLITRTEDGEANERRLAFLRFFVPRLRVALPLGIHAFAMGSMWGPQLKGFPDTFLRLSRESYPTSGLPDLVKAAAVLMRVGLLVVEGMATDAVTRADKRISFRGSEFIRGEEGDGTRLYWPEGGENSGVTVGPGYDMGSRQEKQVVVDLTSVNVSAASAETAAQGVGLRGAAAGQFAADHQDTIILSPQQQRQLFDRIKPQYEQLVQDKLPRSLVPRLFQHEFDAVASLAWNTRAFGTYDCNTDMNRLDLVRAIPDWLGLTNNGSKGLTDRRVRETAMFQKAIYMPKPVVPPNSRLVKPTRRNPSPFSIPPSPDMAATGGDRV